MRKRIRKKDTKKIKNKKFYDKLDSEAVEHYFEINTNTVQIFGTDI